MSASMGEAVLGRLEAVVGRLEAHEARLLAGAPAGASTSAQQRPQAQVASQSAAPSQSGSSGGSSTAEFDKLLANEVAEMCKIAKSIGGGVDEVTQIMKRALEAERNVAAAIAACQQPSDSEFKALLGPVGAEIDAAQAKTRGKRTAEDNHYRLVAEAMGAISWVCYKPGLGLHPPPQHVDDAWQGAELYSNKILMEHRNSNPTHVEWVKAVKATFMGLKGYVKAFHPNGPAWNASGGPLSDFKAPAAGDVPAKKGPPPAAPPPPPPGLLEEKMKAQSSKAPAKDTGSEGMASVLAQLSNKGDGATAGLRKVTSDMKAKNRTDRSGLVSAPSAPKPAAKAPPASAKPAGPPVLELQNGRKWVVENHRNNREIIIEDTNPKQSVYVYNCEGCTIQVKGKVNAISLDKCKKTGLVFESLVASCEAVNSQSLQIQVTGTCPIFAADKVDGLQLYLSDDSLSVEIITAKSSEVNIITSGKHPDDEMVEHNIPEQYISKFVDGKFVTEPVVHSGA